MELSKFFSRYSVNDKVRERNELLAEMMDLGRSGAPLSEIEEIIASKLNPDNPIELPFVDMQEGKPYCLS